MSSRPKKLVFRQAGEESAPTLTADCEVVEIQVEETFPDVHLSLKLHWDSQNRKQDPQSLLKVLVDDPTSVIPKLTENKYFLLKKLVRDFYEQFKTMIIYVHRQPFRIGLTYVSKKDEDCFAGHVSSREVNKILLRLFQKPTLPEIQNIHLTQGNVQGYKSYYQSGQNIDPKHVQCDQQSSSGDVTNMEGESHGPDSVKSNATDHYYLARLASSASYEKALDCLTFPKIEDPIPDITEPKQVIFENKRKQASKADKDFTYCQEKQATCREPEQKPQQEKRYDQETTHNEGETLGSQEQDKCVSLGKKPDQITTSEQSNATEHYYDDIQENVPEIEDLEDGARLPASASCEESVDDLYEELYQCSKSILPKDVPQIQRFEDNRTQEKGISCNQISLIQEILSDKITTHTEGKTLIPEVLEFSLKQNITDQCTGPGKSPDQTTTLDEDQTLKKLEVAQNSCHHCLMCGHPIQLLNIQKAKAEAERAVENEKAEPGKLEAKVERKEKETKMEAAERMEEIKKRLKAEIEIEKLKSEKILEMTIKQLKIKLCKKVLDSV